MKLTRATSGRHRSPARIPLLLALLLGCTPPAAGAAPSEWTAPSAGAAPAGWAAPSAEAVPTGGVRGSILDVDGTAVSFATVLVLPENGGDALLSLEADRRGAYRVDGLRAGRYTVRVRRIG
jgi:hypothetical protein